VIGEAAAPRCDHVVQFYDSDEELVRSVGAFVRSGVASGEVAIVVGTAAHLVGLEAEIEPADEGTIVLLDAEETLSSFLVDGLPDQDAFERVIGDLVTDAATGGRSVRIFGEMVTLLWNRGLVAAAIELETYWNDLARKIPFSLLCAYPTDAVAADEHREGLQEICFLHSDVLGRPAVCEHDLPDAEVVRAFSATPNAPRAARRFVFETLHELRPERLVADAELIVSELAMNSVIHGHSNFTVAIAADDDIVRISVTDNSSVLPKPTEPLPGATYGRGLQIVNALAARWSAETLPHGKIVWAELASLPR